MMTKTDDKHFVHIFFSISHNRHFLTKGEQRDKVKRSANFYGLRSSRPNVVSPVIRVMSREMVSQVARGAVLCGSKFYLAQQYPSLPRLSLLIKDYRTRYIAHLSRLFRC